MTTPPERPVGSLAKRALVERVDLAIHDPEGEREAVSPVPGSIAYWENELDRPLRGRKYMDRDLAERIAIALEQIALELAGGNDQNGRLEPPLQAVVGQTYTPPAPHAQWAGNAQYGVPQMVPPACPIHGKPFRNGRFGPYCPTKLDNGAWCNQKPQLVSGVQQPQQLP